MQKHIVTLIIFSTISSAVFGDPMGDTTFYDNDKFEAKSKPAHISVQQLPELLPDDTLISLKHNKNKTTILLETKYDNDIDIFNPYQYDSALLPIQLEITAENGNIDIRKARATAIRWLETNTGLDGYDYSLDVAEFDYTKKTTENSTYKRTKVNIAKFIPTFSLALDSGENIVIKFKGNIAMGVAHNFARVNNYEDEDVADWSIDYGGSGGVRLFKKLSIDNYYEYSSSRNMDNTTNGVRAKYNLPNYRFFRNNKFIARKNSVQAFRECSETTVGAKIDDDCLYGIGFQLGF